MKNLFLFLILISTLCCSKNSDHCQQQTMPNPKKDIDFVACKLDGKVWRSEVENFWEDAVSAEFADVSTCPRCVSLSAHRDIKNECDTIQDLIVINWSNIQIGENKVDYITLIQWKNRLKSDSHYKLDLNRPHHLSITNFDETKGNMQGSFDGVFVGNKFNDTLNITEGTFKIDQ